VSRFFCSFRVGAHIQIIADDIPLGSASSTGLGAQTRKTLSVRCCRERPPVTLKARSGSDCIARGARPYQAPSAAQAQSQVIATTARICSGVYVGGAPHRGVSASCSQTEHLPPRPPTCYVAVTTKPSKFRESYVRLIKFPNFL
jgi:hypothetical protein